MENKRIICNLYRECLDCGYERFEPEELEIDEEGRRAFKGFIQCPKCGKGQFGGFSFRDKRKGMKK